ncbi:Pnap_2097 family protein [Cupriavidus sp.]|uniref:Pnap_2097 family protein n=1 Tax=Cupriavidus sp. TaxID=1873897 RepID=UPI003D13FFD1
MFDARTSHVAGMPNLSYTGLSENWLLKACGDLHWQGLANLSGQALPEFRDAEGNKAYAAFTAIRLREASLEALGENAAFSVNTRLMRVAGARHFSSHELMQEGDGSGARRAQVSMVSTFIRRQRERDNRSVVRAAFNVPVDGPPPAAAVEMAALAKRFRAGDWGGHLGLEQARHRGSHTAGYLPCPYGDFNGADLLYFANFQAIVDRAEWQWQRFEEPPTVAARDLFFHGNVNLGEVLELSFSAVDIRPDGLAHWCEIRRGSDGEKIADVVTRKRWRMR